LAYLEEGNSGYLATTQNNDAQTFSIFNKFASISNTARPVGALCVIEGAWTSGRLASKPFGTYFIFLK
jgi:hypothetical protein